ncbi:GDSL-type esterase/lipase family protein [Fibrobacter sp. UWEL]|uniref:GDSL-type esterase/lipase family protein n=1 Tax=Fibrobacter sp. UWEL TaxID=1896209 RepID=UPI0009229F2F|nr:GDSL-type esterase/lipase family protein [Fibrobacter sp. UWEL]SHK49184.1 Listeria/Bacterioides repeat-containing protein/Por secretion system C-terminal sorting domain-containing protein [Fibrobacter sp. UWEL]
MRKGFFSKIWQGVVVASMVFATAANAVVTIYLVGDSTMQDWASGYYPKQGMGQDFGYFFDSGLARVFNAGRGGTTSVSYYDGFWSVRGTDRNGKYVFDKAIRDMVQTGDYVMIMIGANDNGYKTGEENFKTKVTAMVKETQQKGAYPILISPIRRSNFTSVDSVYEGYHAYPIYMRELAGSLKVPFIDLDTLSRNYLLSLGQYYSNHYLNMFIDEGEYSTSGVQTDNQHLQQMGANAFGRIVTEQLRFHSDAKVKELSKALKPMYQVDVKVSPEGAATAATASGYYPEGMMVTLKTTPKAGYTFVGWYDGNANKVSGNARSEVKSPYIYTFKMGNKSTQYTAVYAGGSAQKYTGNGGAVTQFSVDVPRKLNGLPFQPEGYTSQPAEDEKVLGPIEFNSLFQAEDSVTMNEGFIEANHLGFTGTGFVNLANNNQSFASYDLDFPEAATTTLAIVYANGGKTDRLINVYLDHDYYVSCPPNGWDTWDTVYTEIMTPKGEGTLQIISMTSDGAPNIDMFGFEMKGVVYKGATRPDTNKVVPADTTVKDTTAKDTSGTDALTKNINLSGMENADVSIFNMQGQLIARRQMMIGSGLSNQELNQMVKSNGLYHVVIRKGLQMIRQTMVRK